MRDKAARRRPDPRRMTVGKAPKEHVHVGLCLLYSGSGFRGLQFQAHAATCHTVEGVLIQALRDAGVIAEVVRGRPAGEHHHFARSCRTDRGVHAVRNMISLFIPTAVFEAVGQLEGISDRLARQLPPTIRVAHVMQLSGSFIPRHCCNRRVYRYMLPLYALLPPCDTWAALDKFYPGCLADVQMLAAAAVASQRTLHGIPYLDVRGGGTAATSADAEAAPAPSWMRDVQASVERCNEVLRSHFTGSRRYHNFSVDIDSNRSGVNAKVIQPDKDEALRVIYRSEVCPRLFFFPCATADSAGGATTQRRYGESRREYDAHVRLYPVPPVSPPTGVTEDTGGSGCAAAAPAALAPPASGGGGLRDAGLPPDATVLPFLFFQIEGGSFLLNMIRKVVGALLAVCRGARESILEEAMSPERRVTTPLAPGPYLYLAHSTYHGYDRSIAGAGAPGRLSTVQDAWSGDVGEAAEAFALHNIAADVVDVDLHAMPPLDDILAARDRALAVRRPHTATEDAHLVEMKEYKPVQPTRIPWPASSEMTVFLRLLRVHNWNVRPIRLAPDSKALREIKNREERAAATATATVTATAMATPNGESDGGDGATEECDARAAVPEGGEDGWMYVAATPEEAAAQRQIHFASWWRRARPWEYDDATGRSGAGGAEVGGEDSGADSDDDGAPPPRRRPRT
ncbi:pseudouridylate synthase-like protein [Novymonas esmeraldas]|uniref:Pseudouridylate synthase-like protein n=1 Tax=Novymonas esmeraldas TaxID=1808958 RepID=A0AAW0F7Y7_9TRYP